ncbi:hypothetical protein JR316_0006278 [Psilocybe cubensis]|uniref:ZZ-type domain-containing protein n=2 Tax=Psilocybe cubensis TaxID=181762 RepID=A0A8H7Y163_PSICU|nr:hypothetical protein JR316_0006278 [Psilocybe cubensis]KAH9481751.1 hypothetical protein JR316_0006278 [Psilocybe cubensis]
MLALSVSVPKFSFLSRLGSIHDPDSWTLEYIALHGHHITQAIDNDGSGFIRISEANAFTQQIPKGWNLPQWCAYSAAGWAYEARIYRRRINRIWLMLTQLLATVLPSNRGYLYSFMVINLITIAHAFTREPVGHNIPNITPELRQLVKEKVLAQDALFREHLKSLKWTVEDESTLHLLYGESPPEKLCTLMMERYLEVACACRTVTVDIKEWIRMAAAFRIMREISVKRMAELGARYEDPKKAADYVSSYHGGIWSYVKHKIDLEESDDVIIPTRRQTILDDFPISWGTPGDLPFLHYKTWEEFSKTLNESDIPALVPRTWDPLDNTLFQKSIDRSAYSEFPVLEWICDHCDVEPKNSTSFKCLTCPDLDFCKDCHELPESEHTVGEHTFYHPVVKLSLAYLPEQFQRLKLEVEDVFEQLQQQFAAQQRSNAKVDDSQVGTEAKENKEDDVVERQAKDGHADKDDDKPEESTNDQDVNTEIQQVTEQATPRSSPSAECVGPIPDNLMDASGSTGLSGALHETECVSQTNSNDIVANESVESLRKEVPASQIPDNTVERKDEPTRVVKPDTASHALQFTCGRCSEIISLEAEFFRCVGSTCQKKYEAPDGEHQWWHTLLSLRKEFIVGNFQTETTVTDVVVAEEKGKTLETPESPEKNALAAPSDSVQSRISILEQKMDVLASTLESRTNRLEYIPKIEEKLDTINNSLQAKVENLELKLDGVITALQALIGGLSTQNVVSTC